MTPHRLVPCLLAVAVALTATACSGPGPSLETVQDEPVLVAPVEATELGRVETGPARGFGFGPDSSANVVVAYAVDLSQEDAAKAWHDAYDDRYSFRTNTMRGIELDGSTADVDVAVIAYDTVQDPDDPDAFADPPEGSTVVTVSVSGRG